MSEQNLYGPNTPGVIGAEPDRQHQRAEVNSEFDCIDEYIAEYVSNISQGGVFIRSKNPLPLGTCVELRFTVIEEDIEIVEGEGEVVRVEMDPANMGMGVAFTRLTAESKELIDRILDRAYLAAVEAHEANKL